MFFDFVMFWEVPITLGVIVKRYSDLTVTPKVTDTSQNIEKCY